MKKKYTILIAIFLLFAVLLSSCSIGSLIKKLSGVLSGIDDPNAEDKAIMVKVLEAIQSRDEEALRKLFSYNTVTQVDGFDQSMVDLFNYYQGNYISLEWKGSGGSGNWDYGEKKQCAGFSYDVKTDMDEFRFSIDYCSIDSMDDNNVGIYSLYVIKMADDTDPEFGYGGDGKETPGINIGIKNVLPVEVDSP